LLSAGTLGLGGHADSDEPVLGLELLHGLGRVIDKGEASGLATTEVGAETEDGDLVLLGLVEATELLTELLLGDVGAVGVEDITAEEISVSLTCSLIRESSGHRDERHCPLGEKTHFESILPPMQSPVEDRHSICVFRRSSWSLIDGRQ
jgi:hypothetical protein